MKFPGHKVVKRTFEKEPTAVDSLGFFQFQPKRLTHRNGSEWLFFADFFEYLPGIRLLVSFALCSGRQHGIDLQEEKGICESEQPHLSS